MSTVVWSAACEVKILQAMEAPETKKRASPQVRDMRARRDGSM
ncbi:hypothetical protein WME94_55530 [Sorangium sp. So ce429]